MLRGCHLLMNWHLPRIDLLVIAAEVFDLK